MRFPVSTRRRKEEEEATLKVNKEREKSEDAERRKRTIEVFFIMQRCHTDDVACIVQKHKIKSLLLRLSSDHSHMQQDAILCHTYRQQLL